MVVLFAVQVATLSAAEVENSLKGFHPNMSNSEFIAVAEMHKAKQIYISGDVSDSGSFIRAEFATCELRRTLTSEKNQDGTSVFEDTKNLSVECDQYADDSSFTLGGVQIVSA